MNAATPKTPLPRKKQPTWRELTDEQRWAKIYKDRETKAALKITSLQEGTGLALPAYCMAMAIEDCAATGTAYIRMDAHRAVVSSIALVSSRMREGQRGALGEKLDSLYRVTKSAGFFVSNIEFLYAVAAATVKLADEWYYPADAPPVLAALSFKIDAEDTDHGNEWGLNEKHATKMAMLVYDTFRATGFYGLPH